MPEYSSNISEVKSATDADAQIPTHRDESKTLKERWKEYREAERLAKAEGLPRATTKNFFVGLLTCLRRESINLGH
jgi:hypothetical protein